MRDELYNWLVEKGTADAVQGDHILYRVPAVGVFPVKVSKEELDLVWAEFDEAGKQLWGAAAPAYERVFRLVNLNIEETLLSKPELRHHGLELRNGVFVARNPNSFT